MGRQNAFEMLRKQIEELGCSCSTCDNNTSCVWAAEISEAAQAAAFCEGWIDKE